MNPTPTLEPGQHPDTPIAQDFSVNAPTPGNLADAYWNSLPPMLRVFRVLNTEQERSAYMNNLLATGRANIDQINKFIMIVGDDPEWVLRVEGLPTDISAYPPYSDLSPTKRPFTWRRAAAPSGDPDGVGSTWDPNSDDRTPVGGTFQSGTYVKKWIGGPVIGYAVWEKVK